VLPQTDSISGIDADPNTGTIYGVNDTTGFLVEIDVVGGTVTPVAAYPDPSETDIDGLAIGDNGKAYLIPDDNVPGLIYVYDLVAGVFETPLTAPWSTSDTFSGGAFITGLLVEPEPGIWITKTVGLDSGICATTDEISVPAGHGGADVYYCYEVMNTGNVTLTHHDLDDSELGTILSGFAFDLAPGASVDTVAAGLELSATITSTTINVATWTAYIIDTMIYTYAMDSATVMVNPPTGVTLSNFGADLSTSLAPLWFAILVAIFIGFGLALRRKMAN
jgi:hypothetical protein